MKSYKNWGGPMQDDYMDNMLQILKGTYLDDQWDDVTEAIASKPRYDYEWMLRDVMHELHDQGQGLDTLLALKNDQLREWWNTELAKIKRADAKQAAREKAKSLLSEEERKLLGMKF